MARAPQGFHLQGLTPNNTEQRFPCPTKTQQHIPFPEMSFIPLFSFLRNSGLFSQLNYAQPLPTLGVSTLASLGGLLNTYIINIFSIRKKQTTCMQVGGGFFLALIKPKSQPPYFPVCVLHCSLILVPSYPSADCVKDKSRPQFGSNFNYQITRNHKHT